MLYKEVSRGLRCAALMVVSQGTVSTEILRYVKVAQSKVIASKCKQTYFQGML